MDLTPETLRSATFRDKLRGYHPDDVDEFLESVARGLEVLLARLRDASERARSVVAPEPVPEADEAVRTLTLAQRTADLAIHEAKAEAERLVKAAEQRARQTVHTAEETALGVAEAAQAELRSDLEKLQAARDQLFGEVNSLTTWLKGERSRIRRALVDVADRVEAVREPGEAPVAPRPVNLPQPPRQKLEASKAQPAPPSPPIERPKAAAPPAPPTPPQPAPKPPKPAPRRPADADGPITAPTPVVPTPVVAPPKQTQPPIVADSSVRPAPPSAAPSPNARGQATPPGGQPAVPRAEKAQQMPPQFTEPADAGVLQRAHEAIVEEEVLDDDPYFAELRAAMNDDTPLGPRDDEPEATAMAKRQQQRGTETA